jgi:hypothetical protein
MPPAFDVQILHRDVRVTVDDLAGQFVRPVPALIGGLSAMPCKPNLGFPAPLAATFTARQRALQPTLAFRCHSGVLRRRDRLAAGERDKGCETEVYSDWREHSVWSRGFGQLDLQADIPFSARTADDGCADLGADWQVAMPSNFYLAGYANDAEAPTLADRQAISDPEVCAIIARFGPEPRKASLGATLHPAEERVISLVQATQDLLLGAETEASQPLVSLADSLQLGRLISVAQTDIAPLVCLDPLLKTGIVKVAECAKHARQRGLLRSRRVKPELVGPEHLSALLRFDVPADRRLRNRSDRCYEVGAGPERRKPGSKQRELFTQYTRGYGLEPTGDIGRCPARIGLDERVNVVGHHFQSVDRHVPVVGDLVNQFLQPILDAIDQDWTAILWTPDKVILEAENCPGVPRISGVITNHLLLYARPLYNVKSEPKKGRAFRCQLPQTVPCAQI